MNHELAKKLKNAGFPQHRQKQVDELIEDAKKYGDTFVTVQLKEWQVNSLEEIYDKLLTIPTLEELMYACGDGFEILLKGCFHIWNTTKEEHEDYKGYFAGKSDTGSDGGHIYSEFEPKGYGKIPLIAVAELYLALQSK